MSEELTTVYFVQHARPDYSWEDDRSMPLTVEGEADAVVVAEVLKDVSFDFCISSPYMRTRQRIKPICDQKKLTLKIDERLKERVRGELGNQGDELQRQRWLDFDFHEPLGESMNSLQKRNISALTDILSQHIGQTILFSTHGAALSAILNFYDDKFGYQNFKRLEMFTPYILKVTFGTNQKVIAQNEVLVIDKSKGLD
ncbi:MAG TPA: histidine phosphatase family protein [Leuconostoc pseudomesenteroides]|uniref:Histidine phosphatase family protein n=1 Tax=Leuconostoc falkenbergense TaxID=2766470 RepID=A0ABT7S0V2_9LACO|nr:histidine phosphatase family protein [Leuconostoc falkenbergense]MDM7647200.1 histidine phosphatase family protein [Leuconostoc falkenbergense]HCU41897.1 histidine phosphatase family protein [Leuconostoc pseudomesenteroides]